MHNFKLIIFPILIFSLIGCDKLKNISLNSTENANKICEEAFEKKTDESFNKCLSVANSASGVVQFGLAEMYSYGMYPPFRRNSDGLIDNLNERDFNEKFKWLNKSANNKTPFVGSAYQLGNAYYYGDEDMKTPKDYSQAIFYYKLASKLGAPYASGHLADMYSEGIGVPKDYYKSYIFNNIALSQCDDKQLEKFRLAVLEDLNSNERKLDKHLINQAQRVASECVDSKFSKCEVY